MRCTAQLDYSNTSKKWIVCCWEDSGHKIRKWPLAPDSNPVHLLLSHAIVAFTRPDYSKSTGVLPVTVELLCRSKMHYSQSVCVSVGESMIQLSSSWKWSRPRRCLGCRWLSCFCTNTPGNQSTHSYCKRVINQSICVLISTQLVKLQSTKAIMSINVHELHFLSLPQWHLFPYHRD